MTEMDVVNYLVSLDSELLHTYNAYQTLLYSLKNKKYNLLYNSLTNYNNNISSYMKTSIKTLLEFLPFIKNLPKKEIFSSYFCP